MSELISFDDASIQPIWDMHWFRFTPSLSEARKTLLDNLIHCNLEIASFILHLRDRSDSNWVLKFHEGLGTRRTFDELNVQGLTNYILSKSSLSSASKQIVILGSVLRHGNERNVWKIPLPPIPILSLAESNPIPPKRFLTIKQGRMHQNLVFDSIIKGNTLSDKAKIGRILLSAITRGGLLHKDTVTAFCQVINQPLSRIQYVTFIDLSLRWRGQDGQEQRRWFPDALTEALLLTNNVEVDIATVPWKYIKAFLKECHLPSAQVPSSITKLIDEVAVHIQITIPWFIAQYATRKNISHSLKHYAWLRLHGYKANKETEIDTTSEVKDSNDFKEEVIENLDQSNWNSSIKASLRQQTSSEALIMLKDIGSQKVSPPLFNHVLQWSIYLIKHGSTFDKKLTIGTIRNYVSRLSNRMYGVIGYQNLEEFDASDFEEIYTQILEDEDNSRRSIARILREFHHFLVIAYTVPKLDYSVLSMSNTLSPVDANIINLDELVLINKMIGDSDLDLTHPDLTLIAKLLVEISFFCGLRRSEILKLRIVDVQGIIAPEILIRPHAARRLKTRSSQRRALLYALLPKRVLDTLVTWVEKRKKQETDTPYSEYVFSIPEKKYAFVPEELIFPAIHKAMRAATGDDTLRFHSLRHSCASWNTLRLISSDHGVPEEYFQKMPITLKWLQDESETFRNRLYVSDEPTRKHIYSITSILGHANSGVTLEHYIHWCDIFLAHTLKKSLKPIPPNCWINASKETKSATYRLLKKGGVEELLKKLRRRNPVRIQKFERQQIKKIKLSIESYHLAYERIIRAWKLLYLHSNNEVSLDSLSERYGFTDSEAKSLVTRAKTLCEIKSLDRHKSFKIRFMTGEHGRRLLCPRKPTTQAGERLAKDFSARISDFLLDKNNQEDYNFFIHHFLKYSRQNTNDLIFKQPVDAKKYLTILFKMGIHKKYITYTWHHGKKVPDLTQRQRKQHWRTALNLTKHQKMGTKQINKTAILGLNGYLSIRIQDYLSDEPTLDQSTEAFRFVLTMQLIIENL